MGVESIVAALEMLDTARRTLLSFAAASYA
jgi:hypothetical protein